MGTRIQDKSRTAKRTQATATRADRRGFPVTATNAAGTDTQAYTDSVLAP